MIGRTHEKRARRTGVRRLLLACGVAATAALAVPPPPVAPSAIAHAYADELPPTDTPPPDLALQPTAGLAQQWTAPPDAAGTDPANPDPAVLDAWSAAVAPSVDALNATAQAASAGDPQALAAVVPPPPSGESTARVAAFGAIPAAASLPSCRNAEADGNVGYIAAQSRGPGDTVQWGAYMFNWWANYGPWVVNVYSNGRRVDAKAQPYPPHGSISARDAPLGSIIAILAAHAYWNGVATGYLVCQVR